MFNCLLCCTHARADIRAYMTCAGTRTRRSPFHYLEIGFLWSFVFSTFPFYISSSSTDSVVIRRLPQRTGTRLPIFLRHSLGPFADSSFSSGILVCLPAPPSSSVTPLPPPHNLSLAPSHPASLSRSLSLPDLSIWIRIIICVHLILSLSLIL